MGEIVRVFPRRTSLTPTDELAFVGAPSEQPVLPSPNAVSAIHVSCTFTWDLQRALELQDQWANQYPYGTPVLLGGPVFGEYIGGDGEFIPGRYLKSGVTFTTKGCDGHCPWCLVPHREGKLRLLDPVHPGNIIQDNNLLQAPKPHLEKVFAMLRAQPLRVYFTGGLSAALVTDWVADQIRTLRVRELFLAADTAESLGPLERAAERLSYLRTQGEIDRGEPARKVRCYMLLGFDGDTVEAAEARLVRALELCVVPAAQLYQPPDQWIEYSPEWRKLMRRWARPALIFGWWRRRDVGT